MKKSLNQWLADLPNADQGEDEGIVATVQITCDVSLYQGRNDGSYTGGIVIQINLPAGEDKEYKLHGFLETDDEGVTPKTIAGIVASAFGIKANDPMWEVEEL